MNTWFLLSAMVPVLLTSTTQPKWNAFRCREGGFTVSMPDRPREEVRSLPQGTLLHRFTSYSQGSPIAFSVVYQDLTPAATRMPLNAFLDGGARAAARDISGHVVACRARSVQGFPGREVAITNSQRLAYHSCLCLAHGRLYQVIVCGAGRQAFSPSATRFLSSFHILPKA